MSRKAKMEYLLLKFPSVRPYVRSFIHRHSPADLSAAYKITYNFNVDQANPLKLSTCLSLLYRRSSSRPGLPFIVVVRVSCSLLGRLRQFSRLLCVSFFFFEFDRRSGSRALPSTCLCFDHHHRSFVALILPSGEISVQSCLSQPFFSPPSPVLSPSPQFPP